MRVGRASAMMTRRERRADTNLNLPFKDLRHGAAQSQSIALSGGFFGILYGAACMSLDISAWLALLSSLLVFSGAVQFAAIGLLDQPAALWTIAISTFLIGNRLILMGIAVAVHLRGRPWWLRWLALHALTDGSWLATLGEGPGTNRFAVYLGAGAFILLLWSLGTLIGALAAEGIPPALIDRLDFVAVIFLSLLLLSASRKLATNHTPWLLSGILSLFASFVLPLPLAFLVAVAVCGGFAAIVRRRPAA